MEKKKGKEEGIGRKREAVRGTEQYYKQEERQASSQNVSLDMLP